MSGATYDTGALLAAERNDRRMWAIHARLLAREVIPIVPASVLVQAWRGGARQAALSRLLALCTIEALTEEQARAAGALAGRAAHDDVTDVTVVEGALRRDDAVVTSDEEEIRRIAGAVGADLSTIAI